MSECLFMYEIVPILNIIFIYISEIMAFIDFSLHNLIKLKAKTKLT